MTADRAEWTGVGAALLFHVALIAALSTSLASIKDVAEPPSMEVELVDEIGLETAAPTPVAQPATAEPPPPPSQAAPQPLPQPIVAPLPPQRPAPQPTARPATQPQRPIQRAPSQPSRRAGIGDDFLKSFDDDLAPRAGPARPAAPTFNAKARMNIGQAIISQARRCAENQPFIGEGANKIRLTVNLKFNRSGRLARSPSILGSAGDAEDRAKYGQLLEDQVRRIFADCAPFRLPADLYDTPEGGWKDFTFTYRVD